nr:solute carrier family 25 member 35-like [Leptinotarsa decemlineata]
MEFLIGGLAATSAGFFTNPLEVVKHHMEISKKSQFTKKYTNFLHAGYHVARQDGLKSLQKGLSPALGAYLVSYGMKLGTYQFGQNRGFTTNEDGKVNVPKSILTSSVGGLLGQYLSNPFYLVKTKHEIDQAQSADNSNNNNEKKSSGYMDTIKRIYREHGIRGFFRGATASLPRAFIGTSQLTSFAVAKESLNKFETFQQHPLFTTVLAGTAAGVVLSMAMTPFDMVLTNMYKQAIGAKPNGPMYRGYFDCMKGIYMKNGLRPFYKGMGPLYLKLGPHTMLCLLFWEQFKGIYENYSVEVENKPRRPVPMNIFYEKVGFLSMETRSDSNYFNETMDEDHKLNVYWN